ncbi:hypothetical protein COCMIDRAFT_1080 [Bipolaris oryzae ATCC 44560]|uniref:NACHT-NTPase and P-loop NTPases N-terminal domain-containing protein n=1 Tax=Bipolaris oryzae ATCC 44560 TaxID=930090 RepID=W7A2Y3_COCMI|nr:uncharacterized protein COCMIDRAFT_1080 [Bipolaris oryzae ATCC 44560]EUC50361.1 hypothetical protein COCMIDRAFT_1080 [Bipolaris oryzae ATCC 44560]
MEALSGVASGMAVVSLSIQLIDSIDTIKTFVRKVKDAQQELERLVDLLERLEALLKDVHNLMKRQTSLQAEHFPIPSMTIFKCLESCEKTLEPLHTIIDKYAPATSKGGTRMEKLKTGLRFSLKAKDVKDFETRIERETVFLHASLGANCGAILMQLGPALLKNQNNSEATRPTHMEISIPDSESAIVSPKEDMTSLSTARTTRVSSSVIPVHWLLGRLGVHRRKIVRRVPENLDQRTSSYEYDHDSIVSEDYETTFLWSVLGYGLTWIQRRSFGVVLPSLNTFPLVHGFPNELYDTMNNGVNLEQFVSNQIANLGPEALLRAWPFDKRVVFQTLETGEWELGFEWALDEEACGYLLISEYQSLTIEDGDDDGPRSMEWPFCEREWGLFISEWNERKSKWCLRYERRRAAKARKQRARNGQKMPGAWVN